MSITTANYLEFIPCCETSTVLNFKVPFGFDVLSLTYQYVGISENGLIKNSCYTVAETLGPISFVLGLPDINAIDLINSTGCDAPECECDSLVGFEIFPCCDTANVININIDFSSCGEFENSKYVINYLETAPGFTTPSGFEFQPGECYNISRIEPGIYQTGPPCEDFTVGIYRLCEDAINDDFCPACELGLEYLIFTNCCTEDTILFKGIDASSYFGVQEYIGAPVDGLTNVCYSIEIGTVGDLIVPSIPAWNDLPEPPLYNVSTFNTISAFNPDCKDYPKDCPSCETPCYTLIDCDGNFFNTTSDLSAYVGTFVKVNNGLVSFINTYLVLENTGDCKNAVNTITVSNPDPEPCPIICYQVTGNPTTVTYINSDRELVTTSGNVKICSYATPLVTGPTIGYVIALGECTDGECPDICFEFTNCDTGEVLVVSNSPSIIEYYAQEQIVTLNGYDGCWSIDITEVCECPVSVTVLTAYASCTACLPIVNYKFTNCNNKSIIRYSIDDYSAYVGQTVELECGECWFVSEIDFVPPSTQSIVILYTFPNCTACNRTYYKLTDCLEPENITYTYTDLSIYVDQVIKIKGCDSCFKVEETREPVNAGIVTVTNPYLGCPECLETFPCVCNRITNQDTIAKDFTYLDCLFDEVTINLQPNETSEKVCLINWVLTPEEEALVYIEHFGDCINGQCPVVPLPKRKVKPGYSTPSCDIEKYEKITCRSSEILYKQVIRLRYGISNCCPEDEEKWLIKKELIDLDALRDPDYICRPVTSCCNQPINDCGCNTLKTCNS